MANHFVLNKTQCKAIVPYKTRTRYWMDQIHITKEGMSETTDGKVLIRVYPMEPIQIDRAVLVSATAAAKAVREAKGPTRKTSSGYPSVEIPAPDIVVSPDASTLSYTTKKDLSVNVLDAVIEVGEASNFPPTDNIVEGWSRNTVKHEVTLGVAVLKKMIDALSRAGCESVRFDFLGDKNAVRIKSKTDDSYLIGLIMPVNIHGVDSLSRPQKGAK